MADHGADLLVDQQGRVRVLTLNRPAVRNALSRSLAESIAAAVEEAEGDTGTRAVVIRGAGTGFSAGYDLSTPYAGEHGPDGAPRRDEGVSKLAADARGLKRLTANWQRLWSSPLPIIAQVHGHCLAGGTDLALHCDLVVVAADARIGYPPLRSLGVPPSQMWLYHVGPQWTKRLFYTGDTITGRLAAEIGFALLAVEPDELEPTVMTLAARIAQCGREMLMANKAVLNHGIDLMGRERLQEMAALRDAMAHQSPEALAFTALAKAEGLKAALVKRDEPFAPDDPLDI